MPGAEAAGLKVNRAGDDLWSFRPRSYEVGIKRGRSTLHPYEMECY